MNSGEMENSSASRLVLLRLFLVLRGFVEGVSGSPVGAEGMAGGGDFFFGWPDLLFTFCCRKNWKRQENL